MTAGPDDPGSSGPSDPGKSSTSGSAAGWYYYLDLHGAQQGPIHVAQLAPMVGSASPQSALFWQSGWPEWKRMADIPELMALRQASANINANAGGDGDGGGDDETTFVDDDGTVYDWDAEAKRWKPREDAADDDPNAYSVAEMTFQPLGSEAKQERDQDQDQDQDHGQKQKQQKQDGDDRDGDDDGDDDASAPPSSTKIVSTTAVYVSGLPPHASVLDVAKVFEKCGIIREDPDTGGPKVKLYKDRETGAPKGDALVVYLREPSVELAVKILDGAPFEFGDTTGPTMSVSPAEFDGSKKKQKQQKKSSSSSAKTKGKAKAKQDGGEDDDNDNGDGNDDDSGDDDDSGGKRKLSAQEIERRKRLKKSAQRQHKQLEWGGLDDTVVRDAATVVLKHMFALEDVYSHPGGSAQFMEELEQEVRAECCKFGDVDKVKGFPNNPDGVVTVKFQQRRRAYEAIQALNGRWFGGQRLVAELYDGFSNFAKSHESHEDQMARLRKFGEALEES